MVLLKCGVRYQEAREAPTLILYLRQDAKQHRIHEFKRHLAVHFLLYNTSWGVRTGPTMEAGCSAQPQRGQRHKGLFEEQKTNFIPFFVFKVWLQLRAGSVGLAHFSQTGNKGTM